MILRNLWILPKNDKSSFEKVSKAVFESFYFFFKGEIQKTTWRGYSGCCAKIMKFMTFEKKRTCGGAIRVETQNHRLGPE